jgi:transcriptional regulator with XRE-family HTH domain
MFNRIAIGKRIVEARKSHGLHSPAALAKAIQELLDRRAAQNKETSGKKRKDTLLARQTVANWEAGKIVPPWTMVELMAEVFGPDHDEGWIMFGERRAAQLREEGYVLARVSSEEARLLQAFREADRSGQESILGSAAALSKAHPAPPVSVHPLRRREDLPVN